MSPQSGQIGMSLSPDYLAGDLDALEHRWYGPVGRLLTDLAHASVSSIELRTIGAGTSISLALAAADRVLDTGFGILYHGLAPDAPLDCLNAVVHTHVHDLAGDS